jgi:hypothetical protein
MKSVEATLISKSTSLKPTEFDVKDANVCAKALRRTNAGTTESSYVHVIKLLDIKVLSHISIVILHTN